MVKQKVLKAAGLLFLMAGSLTSFSQEDGSYVPCQEMPGLIQNYNADYGVLARIYSPLSATAYRGGGENYDGRGGSPEKRERLNQLCRDYLKKLDSIPFNNLPQECKVDYLLFRRDLNEKLRLSDMEAQEYEKIKSWVPFADKIYELEKIRRRGQQPEAEKVAKEWSDIATEVKALETRLKDEKTISPASIYEASAVISNLRQTVSSINEFYNGYDPMFSWWVPKSYAALDTALTVYATQFKNKINSLTPTDKSGIVGQPAGREELVHQLTYEMIPYTPEELIDIANKEFAWCDKEMLKASREMGFGDNWKAALEKVKNTYVPAGKQPEAILKLYNESVDFVKEKDLITIPPLAEETWGMIMMTPERQLVNPFLPAVRTSAFLILPIP